ncbi:autotransporter outer membrane beta-barrel domain-containing protein [Succinivibrio dextrinosolvens]|uniref:autotransporter family protein n=1 Tax=Succinivibrio dextrinosolvens TaxID=83771 RepID=UPI0019205F83|nr:autotransporter outer membrane beta-barrel domain-containing protein [Succinivibrio dextrinosolvens]
MIKQTRNAMHMLIEAYKAVYKQAMSKGIGVKCTGNNLLKILLILSSVGCAQASTIKMPYGNVELFDITPTITEKTLENNTHVTAKGNLGHEMSWMLFEAVDHGKGNELEEDINSEKGSYPSAVNLLNEAEFENVSSYDLNDTQNITLKSITVNGGLVNLQPGNGENQSITIEGATNVNSGFLYLGNNHNTSTTTAKSLVTYKGQSTGQISGNTTFENGLLIDGYAAVDVGSMSNITGKITIKSKGPSDSNAFSDLEKQYGVWGKPISKFLEEESETTGGLNVGHGSSKIAGEVDIDGGKLTVVDFADVSSNKSPAPELTIDGEVNVTNGGEILVMGTKDTSGNSYHAKLTIEENLNVSGSNSLVSVGSKKNSEAQGELIVKGNTTVKNDGKIVVGENGIATLIGEVFLDGNSAITTNGNGIVRYGSEENPSSGTTTINNLVTNDKTTDYVFENEATLTDTDITLKDVTFNNKATLNTAKISAEKLAFENTAQLNTATISTKELTFTKDAEVNSANVTTNTLTFNDKAKVYDSTIQASEVNLSSLLKLDPSTLTTSSLLFNNNGKLAILTGSATYVGNSSDFESTGSVATGKALLSLASGITLDSTNAIYLSGSENNDDSITVTDNSVTLKSGSTLELYGGAFTSGAAITFSDENGTFTVEDGSKIVLKGKQFAGKNVVVTGAGSGISVYTDKDSSKDWKDYLSSDNILYQIKDVATTDGKYVVDLGVSSTGVAAVSGGISPSLSKAIVNQANGTGTDSTKNNGLGIMTQMIEKIGTGSSSEISRFRDEANSVTGFIFGGVPLLNELVAQIAHDNVEQHNGFTTTGANHAAVKGTNATVWAMPFYKQSKSDSFKIEGSTYGLKAKIYGLSMGTDFEVADGFRLGFDGIVGHAKTDSKGSLDPSEDDASFWGLGTYGSYNYENLKVMADIGYTAMNTDTDLHTSYGTLTAKNTKSYTFTTGVNAKYNFALTYADVAPHVGIRYNHANIDKYKVKRQGDVMLTGDSISQNYFQFPIGVEVSKQFVCGEWNLKPMFDLTATINAGDKDLDAKTTLTGFDNKYGEVSTNAEVLDTVSIRGSLGLEAKYGALGLGVGYSFTGSENVKDHVFAAGVKYTF